jgi:hypothetical protein
MRSTGRVPERPLSQIDEIYQFDGFEVFREIVRYPPDRTGRGVFGTKIYLYLSHLRYSNLILSSEYLYYKHVRCFE